MEVKNKSKFKRYRELLGISMKMDFAFILRDAKVGALFFVGDILIHVSSISGVFLLAWRFGGIGGMDQYEILFMLGYQTLVSGFLYMSFAMNNTAHISRVIGRGQLEHMMIQPLSIVTQLLTVSFSPVSGSSNVIMGGVVIWIALSNLGKTVSIVWVLSLIGSAIISLVILLALSFVFSSLAFYAPAAAEEISTYVIDATDSLGSFPLSGMPGFIKITLITILPSGLMGWFPALMLLGKTPMGMPSFYPVIIALLLSTLAVILFKKGMDYYVRTGSNRYSSRGFRN